MSYLSTGPEMLDRKKAEAELSSWLSSLQEPEEAQAKILDELTKIYAKTGYGLEHGIEPGMDLETFRNRAQPRDYRGFKPYILRVLRGDTGVLLNEEPLFMGITSGSTGIPKIIPITERDAELRISIMLKGLARYASYWRDEWVFRSACLAPCMPSEVKRIYIRGRAIPCGYISGIYAELIARALGLERFFKPYLSELNSIGPGVRKTDWARRFEIILEILADLDVGMAIGAGPALWMFAKWLKREKGMWPGDIWSVGLVLCAGVPNIQEHYVPELKRAFGPRAVVIEAYGATEGMFAIQADDKPYLVPFYDAYFLEAKVGREIKMLYEMKAGEVGRLVVSTPVFPRYEIGDVVACYGDGLYFRVLGRDKWGTWMRIWLGKLIERAARLF